MKILIVKLSSFGDIIHTLPVLTSLKQGLNNPSIGWVASKKFSQILEEHDFIDNLYELENTPQSWFANLKHIRKQKYDVVLDLQGLIKSALFSKLTGCKTVIGLIPTREKLADVFYSHTIDSTYVLDQSIHVINRNLDITKAFKTQNGLQVPTSAPKSFNLPILSLPDGLELEKGFIALSPESSWESKNWPLSNWLSLIDKLSAQSDRQIVLLGSSEDFLKYSTIGKENLVNLMGKTTLSDLMGIVPQASIVIGSDSGILHLASAYGVKTLGLYGATSPERTGPWDGDYLTADVDCSPCHKRKCKWVGKEDELKCLKQIDVDSVIEKVYEITDR